MKIQLDITWCYYLIAIIYVLVIALKAINYVNKIKYIKDNMGCKKIFIIKKDFFSTVAISCFIGAVLINGALLYSRGIVNKDSIIITLLIIGFTLINSLCTLYYNLENSTICLLGYTLENGDIKKIKSKDKKLAITMNITLNRTIESYDYVKFRMFGANRNEVKALFNSLIKVSDEE